MSHGLGPMLTISADLIPTPRTPPARRQATPKTPSPPAGIDLSTRPPLKTPYAHIYKTLSGPPSGPTAHRNSLYVNSPSPPTLPEPRTVHPAFRRKRPTHVPIIARSDTIDSPSRHRSIARRFQARTLSVRGRLFHSKDRGKGLSRSATDAATRPDGSQHRFTHISGQPQVSVSEYGHKVGFPTRGENLISALTCIPAELEIRLPKAASTDSGRAVSPVFSSGHKSPLTPSSTMSRPTVSHSAVPDSAGLIVAAAYDSEKIPVSMSSSQHSFTSEVSQDAEAPTDQRDLASPPQSAKTVTSPTADPRTPTANPSNLSGLVCNVHRCTGKEPRGLVGATTTILGDKLYVFGGRSLSKRKPHMTADLYELDLIYRNWTKIRTKGQTPSPRYFHSVCALGDSKLICYGGMSPAPQSSSAVQSSPNAEQPDVVVMSDVHIYDTKTRTWTRIDTQDTPQGRYAHCAAVLPSTAVFSSPNAPLSAIHHNPSDGDDPNAGQLGLALDGTGGAEMVVVGGQDNANHYIEQISVFNLRSLKWTATNSLGRSCGAYRSVVAPLVGFPASRIGAGIDAAKNAQKEGMIAPDGNSMLIYSNYNFLDVKLELQCRTQDGKLEEKRMSGPFSPPGLRFPNGGVLNNHFVISGTYLTSSRQEYALWALDLRTQTWSRIDVGGSVFGQGSWNRGVLWPRRNTFVILGNRKRNLVEDYNHRRINFTNICLVELEAFGLYENPRLGNPSGAYASYSTPGLPASLVPKASLWSGGGRPHFAAAEELGQLALNVRELADMDILTLSGERVPANSHVLARRWGAYFVQMLREGTSSPGPAIARSMNGLTLGGPDDRDSHTIRNAAGYRNSSVTITPSIATAYTSATTLTAGSVNSAGTSTLASNGTPHHGPSASISSTNTPMTNGNLNGPGGADESTKPFHAPSPASLPASTRSRTLYLPHSAPTVHTMLHFIYTNTLPPVGHPLSTPQILCSLLQIARPYRIDGLLEAVLQRLHQVMDSRSAAAIFNACAMAAGGGRGTGFEKLGGSNITIADIEPDESRDRAGHNGIGPTPNSAGGRNGRGASERKNAFGLVTGRSASQTSAAGRDSTDVSEDEGASGTDNEGGSMTDGSEVWDDGIGNVSNPGTVSGVEEEVWTGDRSCVIGLQKRGLRGLMEGRKMRERGESAAGTSNKGSVATLT